MNLEPIALVSSPWRQKFAIPRQPNLVPQATGELHFLEHCADPNCLRGIEQFSHLWLIFLFHETAAQGWSATVAPPRLGGNERLGVFATRSMYRPNPLGLSVVEFAGVEQRGRQLVLKVRGLDLLDGTPVLDIKPYLPYADAIAAAQGGFAAAAPPTELPVRYSTNAGAQLQTLQTQYPGLEALITSVLQQDPRPAQHVRKDSRREFAMLLYDLNIRWQMVDEGCEVLDITPTQQTRFPQRGGDR
ncbi:MAG: tRNA (N6-threonylcarbamoyladenosine(37)-N6)-methyltransferase TrmO [Pseudohongiellaceae bacterium]